MVSVPRKGISESPEDLEARLRRIELELAQRSLANLDISQSSRALGTPGQVTGLTIDRSVIGGLQFVWNANTQSDIHYSIEISTSSTFAASTTTTRKTREPRYFFAEGNSTLTYYIRVRAINSRGDPGPYSSVLNSTTGQATANNLISGAANEVVRTIQTSFSPATLSTAGTTTGVYGSTAVETIGGPILVFAHFKWDYSYSTNHIIFLRTRINGISVIEYEEKTSFTSAGTATMPGNAIPAVVNAGLHEIDFQVEVDNNGQSFTTTITPDELVISVWEPRR